MQRNINLIISMQEYNDIAESLYFLKNFFCNIYKEHGHLHYNSKEFNEIKDTIDVLFFSFVDIIDDNNSKDDPSTIPKANISNVLSNSETESALTALEKAIANTKDIVS